MKTLKKFPIYTLVLACFSLFTMTSCLKDDNNQKQLTQEEITNAFYAIRGYYQGQLSYPNYVIGSSTTPVTGKKDITWNISEEMVDASTMRMGYVIKITDFPTEVIAMHISSSYKEMAEALKKQTPIKNIICDMGIYSITPVSFIVNPRTPAYDVEYGGVKHKVQIAFYANSGYSYGSYVASSKEYGMQIVAGAVYVDEKLVSDALPNPVALQLTTKRDAVASDK